MNDMFNAFRLTTTEKLNMCDSGMCNPVDQFSVGGVQEEIVKYGKPFFNVIIIMVD